MINPINTYVNTVIGVKFSNDSGIRWKKAPLSNAPADKATKESSIFFSSFSLHHKENIPTKDIRLLIKVASIIINSMCILLIKIYWGVVYKIICFLDVHVNNVCKRLNKYPVNIIAKVTIPKNIAINFNFIALLNITASGRLNAAVAIIKAKAVPNGIPF